MDPSSMARFVPIMLTVFVFSSSFLPGMESQRFARTLSADELGLKAKKLTHLNFYTYEKFTDPGMNIVRVAQAAITNQSSTLFGAVNVADVPILVSPNKTAQVIGRFQGLSAGADQAELALLQAFNFAFSDGEYNGSTITMLGRNAALKKVREFPIVGGTGVFRFTRGYVEATTVSIDTVESSAFVEYNLYVSHY